MAAAKDPPPKTKIVNYKFIFSAYLLEVLTRQHTVSVAVWIHPCRSRWWSSLVPRSLPDLTRSYGEKPIFLHSCEIKSGNGLGIRLVVVHFLYNVSVIPLVQ